MKKTLGMAGLILVLTSGLANATSTTGSITIQGSVAANTAIAVSTVSGFNSLNLTGGGTDVEVASINEKNNTRQGYTVKLTSANAGALKNIVSGSTLGTVGYTAKYGSQAVTLAATAQTVTSVTSQTSPVNTNKTLTVSFPGDPGEALVSGAYSDTLTFDIIAN